MADGRIIAIGGSAGAFDTLRKVLPGIPRDFETPILIVVHIASDERSVLAGILDSSTELSVVAADDGMTARGGCVYVAPPDRHMFVDAPGRIRVLNGPRENRHRPAIDPLFRSIARVYGAAGIGILLSGGLDDGAAGLAVLQRSGGDVAVQDPEEAAVASMPEAALRLVPQAMKLTTDNMAAALIDLSRQRRDTAAELESALDLTDNANLIDMWTLENRKGSPSQFTCPECSGTLFEIDEEGKPRYRCRTGHGYSFDSLSTDQSNNLERILWAAARALQERSELYRRMSERFGGRGKNGMAARAREQAEQDAADAEQVRQILFRRPD